MYAALAATCLYFALCFYDFKTGEFRDGRYSAPKFIFFVVMFFSALLDVPLFIGCIVEGGPHDCEWESPSYVVFWLFHLIATCGYMYAIITPAILWSDIIYQKDGMFWNSAYPLDATKLFFRVAFVLFCANELATVVGAVVMQDPSHFGSFDTNSIGAITDCITPIMTTIITFGCLWSGIELQRYVMNVGLGGGTRNRVLMQLNLTMFLIAATYMYRSLLVLSLYDPIPQQYKDAMHPIRSSFFLWLLGTRWLPAVVCSFCLVNEMRFKGSANTNSRHSQSAVIRASKDVDGEHSHTLYQSLLRVVGASNTRNSAGSAGLLGTNAAGRRTVSGESQSTADSALRDSYSMLSSVDFPDNTSETSSTYILSPVDSPDRQRAEHESLLGRSQDMLISNSSGGGSGNNKYNKGSGGNVSSQEAERIARKHRKSLQQLGQHHTNNTSSYSASSNNTTHNAIYAQRHPHHIHINPNMNANTTNTHATPANIAYSDSPHYLSRAQSGSGSDTDFYYPTSRTTSIDHFFTFAAPNLNLSNIGNGSGHNNSSHGNSSSLCGSSAVNSGSVGVPPLPAVRSVPSTLGPAHIHNTLNATNNNTTNPNTSNNNSASTSPNVRVIAASPTLYRPVSDNAQSFAEVYRNQNDPPSPTFL